MNAQKDALCGQETSDEQIDHAMEELRWQTETLQKLVPWLIGEATVLSNRERDAGHAS